MTPVTEQVARQGHYAVYMVLAGVSAMIFAIVYGIRRYIRRGADRGINSLTNRKRGGGSSDRGGGGRSVAARREIGDQLHKNALVGVWNRFMRAQPWNFRSQIREYPQTLVLGPAGTGKSALIDSQVDWQAQKKRFFPSVTDDALIQIYIGSRVVVQEVSPALLADDSADARRALKRLWKKSTSRRPPGVLVVLDAVALGNAAPEELRRQAQLVRGKIDLLAEVHRRPQRVSVVLTHMDGFSGFEELATVCSRHALPLGVDLRAIAAQRDSRDVKVFGAREEYLGLALTASPSESFSRVVELMSSSGGIGPVLAAFLGPLCEKSRLSSPPELDKLFFVAPGLETDRAFGAPAAGSLSATPLRRYAMRAAAVGGFVTLLLGAAHCNHARKLDDASAAVAQYELASSRAVAASQGDLRGSLERADNALHALQSAEGWWPLLKLSSRSEKRQLAAKVVLGTRSAYLLPLLHRGAVESRELTIYLLGVLYAARDNALGEWIAPRAKHWATNLNVPERAVSAYVHWSEHAWTEPVSLSVGAEANDPTLSLKPWIEFFTQLQAAYDSQDVGEELLPLQQKAAALAEALDRSKKFAEVPNMLTLLPPATPFDVNALLKAPKREEAMQWVEQNRLMLDGLLAMVQQGDLSPQLLGRMTLTAFVAHANKLMAAGGSDVYAFKLERPYSFGRQRWSEMVARASIQIYVRQPGYPFLPREAPPAQAQHEEQEPMDATRVAALQAQQQQQRQAPSSPSGIPGSPQSDPYHRTVVDGLVRPALDDFSKKLPTSPIAASDKATLAAYTLEQANAYAQRYREALYASYQPYHLNVRTAAELPPAINQMIQPNGGMMRWLRGLAEDADLPNLDTVYLRPLAEAVAPLQPIVRLVKPGKDAGPAELGKYVTMVMNLSRDLAGTQATGAAGGMFASAGQFPPQPQLGQPPMGSDTGAAGASNDGGLQRFLSPVARVAMNMLLQPQTSYLAQTNQWLAEVGIAPELRSPFLEPFDRVLDFGVPELENALKQQWTRTWNVVAGTFSKYPFRRKTSREVEPAEIDAFKESGGAFWAAFKDLAPFCVQRSDGWSQRGPLARPLNLPPGMLSRVNLIARLARVYFTKDGARAPLAITVTPLPLPKELDREGYVTMSFLRAGGASVFGFNQAPTARSFTPTWWGAEGASIGIMFGDPVFRNQPDRTPDRSIDTSASPWALYHLIERASQVGDTVVWTLPGDGIKRRTVPIRFVVRGDAIALHPWTQFGKE